MHTHKIIVIYTFTWETEARASQGLEQLEQHSKTPKDKYIYEVLWKEKANIYDISHDY